MKPLVSIIMGSTSDLPVMEKACKWLNDNKIPFEVNALSIALQMLSRHLPKVLKSVASRSSSLLQVWLLPFLELSQLQPLCL